jgi:hypothetical protein
MTITITLPPETEEQLRAQSQATGKDISTLVVEAVEARLSLAKMGLSGILGPVHVDLRQSGMGEDELEKLLQEELDASRSQKAKPGKSA